MIERQADDRNSFLPPGHPVDHPPSHPIDCEGGWITCSECWGEGDVHDCGEDCCCCSNPDEDERLTCSECLGAGGHPCPACAGEEA